MEGTLVPAYTINSFLGQVPVLGPLIVGREGEGIFALTYRVRGSANDPSVTVNPLSALAPGFLRRLFEFGGATVIDPPVERPSSANSAVLPDDTAPAAPQPDVSPAPQN